MADQGTPAGNQPDETPEANQPAAGNGGPTPAPRPVPPARPAQPGAARPAAAGASRPAPAAGAARPAAATGARPAPAARPAGAAPTAERLGEAVRREPAGGGGAQAERLVYVWPHLVTIEFISALLMLLSMVVLSTIVNSPLEAHANPDRTPNPSKAPWYFLNLQELLLHMHPALAGVLVPTGALGALAAIPYFDRDQRDVGKWFGTASSVAIFVWVFIYTFVVETLLVLFDEFVGVKPLLNGLAAATGINYFRESAPLGVAALSFPDTIVPTTLMLGPIIPMVWFLKRKFNPTTREWMVAFYTGFFASYIFLTIIGTFFRGQGMHLCLPWDPCQIRID